MALNRDPFPNTTFIPASNVLNPSAGNGMYSMAPITSNPSNTLAPTGSNLSNPLITPMQSTPGLQIACVTRVITH